MILDSSVGRARVCGFRVGWQGATRRMVAPCNEEQRSQAARKPCNRVRSGLSRWVNAIEDEIFGIRQAFQETGSAQLGNQG